MAPNYSKYLTQKTVISAATAVSVLLWYLKTKKSKKLTRKPHVDIKYMIGDKPTHKVKAQVDMVFVRQLKQLMKITVPGAFSTESAFLVLVALSLIARSICDIWMIQNGTLVETALINMDRELFWKRLLFFFSGMPLISIVNNVLKYAIGELKLRLRTNLTNYLYDEYLKHMDVTPNLFSLRKVTEKWKWSNLCVPPGAGLVRKHITWHTATYCSAADYLIPDDTGSFCSGLGQLCPWGFTYYKMSNLDNRIANPDQLLTVDVDKFCDTFTDLYSNIAKPLLDIVIYVYRLTSGLGGQTPGVMMLYLVVSGILLTYLRRPTGRMTVTEQKLEGEFRYINSRLITNSEEVAFYQGNNREKLTVLAAFNKLTDHLRRFLEFRVLIGVADNIVAKYIATVVGFYAVSIPFLTENHYMLGKCTPDERFNHYYTFGRMLVKFAEAIGRLVLAGREMTRLAGFTARVTELIKVLKDLNQGRYERTMMEKKEVNGDGAQVKKASRALVPGSGKVIFHDNTIMFEDVPLVTPNGDVLIEELTFKVKSGMNVLVCGPNGCGKSSLFRILGELWPLFGGTVVKPPRGKLFYIPQRPYMTLGTLRDQIIYPHTREEMMRRGRMDSELEGHLERVQLSYLLRREGGWDAIEDWIDVLSGGEKQRIAMARLFYHNPQFAILDECTSAVSVDVEDSMYQYCREVGITLFTVSHRKSLWKHHDYVLQMDGRGSYEFGPIEEGMEEFGS